MKRILTIICCLTLLLGIVPFCVSASETASQNMQTVEYLEDGSYIVTELEVTPAVARTARSYTKKSTSANGRSWKTVEGGGGSVSCNPVCYSTLFLQGALPANRSANYFSVGKNR